MNNLYIFLTEFKKETHVLKKLKSLIKRPINSKESFNRI